MNLNPLDTLHFYCTFFHPTPDLWDILKDMRKIDTWLFIVFFLVAFMGIAFIVNVTLWPFLARIFESYGFYTGIGASFILYILICFVSAFGLRSYYAPPTSLVRLVSSIVLLQLFLNVISPFFTPPTLIDIVTWLVTAVSSWIVLYVSLYIADRYFTKHSS